MDVDDARVDTDRAPWPAEDPEHTAARNARLHELSRRYPSQQVACRDEWDGAQLVEPFVLVVSTDYAVLHGAIDSLPREERSRCMVHFLWPPGVTMALSYWLVRDENGNVRPLRSASDSDEPEA